MCGRPSRCRARRHPPATARDDPAGVIPAHRRPVRAPPRPKFALTLAPRPDPIEALWLAQDLKKTRHRLWDLAIDARAMLGDALIHEGERYRLDRAKVHIHLDQLDQLLANTDSENEPESLEAALVLW